MKQQFRTGLLATALLLLAGALPAQAGKPAATLPGDSIYQQVLPLTDASGQSRDWRSLRGKPRLMSMFYASCKFVCPLIIESGKAVDRKLSPGQQQKLGMVLISMDPARDTPAVLKAMTGKRKLDGNRWLLATPRADDVRTVAGLLGIRYRQLADGEFNHTSALILVDADGRILARTEKIGSQPDPAFLAEVRKALGE